LSAVLNSRKALEDAEHTLSFVEAFKSLALLRERLRASAVTDALKGSELARELSGLADRAL
jgi:hypothetical protein